MVKSKISVLLRTRPTPRFAETNLTFQEDGKTLQLKDSKAHDHQFKFDQILHNASQESVFEASTQKIVTTVLEGSNATILAYGQTGAGKTYTMTGGKDSFKQRGIIPRVIQQLFAVLKLRPEANCTVRCSYLEIYNEVLIDLLDLGAQPSELAIQEDLKDHTAIRGLKCPVVTSEAECLAYLFEGETNRTIGEHELNRESSRSHTIFSISVENQSGGPGSGAHTLAKLDLVDLAGSERVSKTKSEGVLLKEATHINKSLSFLEQVILALGERNRDHIPYRSSKLTHVLKNSLGGNCVTLMIACIWGEAAQLDETVSTCRFAQRMQCVANDYSVNVRQDPAAQVRRLEKEVAELKAELAMHDQLAGGGAREYGPYSEAARSDLRRQVLDFFDDATSGPDSLEPLQLASVTRQMRETLLAAKAVYRQQQFSIAAVPSRTIKQPLGARGGSGLGATSGPARGGSGATQSGSFQVPKEYVGELQEEDQGLAVGVAPADARPFRESEALSRGDPLEDSDGPGGAAIETARPGKHPSSSSPPDQKTAFEDYKKGPGAVKLDLLVENKARVKSLKKRAKELALSINAVKQQLDQIRSKPEPKPELEPEPEAEGEASSAVTGEEEEGADGQEEARPSSSSSSQRQTELKSEYREQHGELQAVKSELEYTQKLVEQCTQELVLEFGAWYAQEYGVSASQASLEEEDSQLDVAQGYSTKGHAHPASRQRAAERSISAFVRDEDDGVDADAFYSAQSALQRKTAKAKGKNGVGAAKKTAMAGTFGTATRPLSFAGLSDIDNVS